MLKARLLLIFMLCFAMPVLAQDEGAVACKMVATAGQIKLIEKPLQGPLRESMVDLFKMLIPTRSTGFSYKDMHGKDQGKLILAVQLDNDYTVELTYASDYRQTNRFVLDRIVLVDPSGKDEDLSKDPLERSGALKDKIEIDPELYPEFVGHEFEMPIYSRLDGPLIAELERIGPKLELLDKDDLRALTKVKSYALIKAFLQYRATTKVYKKYVMQGPIKQAYSLTIGSAISVGFAYALSLAMPEQVKDLAEKLGLHSHHTHTVVQEEKMPSEVRTELHRLEKNVNKGGVAKVDRDHYPALLTYLEMKDDDSENKHKK